MPTLTVRNRPSLLSNMISVGSSEMFFNKESVAGLSPKPARLNFNSYLLFSSSLESLINVYYTYASITCQYIFCKNPNHLNSALFFVFSAAACVGYPYVQYIICFRVHPFLYFFNHV